MIKKTTIKKIIKEILLASIILLVVSNVISYLRQPQIASDELPHLSLQTIEGKTINFEEYKGKPLLIHFWATWCPTCKLETNNIDSVSKKYQVITIAVNSGDIQGVKKFMKEKDAHFDVIDDKESILASQFSVEVFPTSFIYDKNSKLLFSEVGYTSTAGLLARMTWASNR